MREVTTMPMQRRPRSPTQQAATLRMLAANRARRGRVSSRRRPPGRTQPQVRAQARGNQPSARILATLRTPRRRTVQQQATPRMLGLWSGRPVRW